MLLVTILSLSAKVNAHFSGLIVAHGSDLQLGNNHYYADAQPDHALFKLGNTSLPLKIQENQLQIELGEVDKHFRPCLWYHRGQEWTRILLADRGWTRTPLSSPDHGPIDQLLVMLHNEHFLPPQVDEHLEHGELLQQLANQYGDKYGMALLNLTQ